jgi:hypothetical protein
MNSPSLCSGTLYAGTGSGRGGTGAGSGVGSGSGGCGSGGGIGLGRTSGPPAIGTRSSVMTPSSDECKNTLFAQLLDGLCRKALHNAERAPASAGVTGTRFQASFRAARIEAMIPSTLVRFVHGGSLALSLFVRQRWVWFSPSRRADAYKWNPCDCNVCWGTSIGGNFNCSFAPICASNFK